MSVFKIYFFQTKETCPLFSQTCKWCSLRKSCTNSTFTCTTCEKLSRYACTLFAECYFDGNSCYPLSNSQNENVLIFF